MAKSFMLNKTQRPPLPMTANEMVRRGSIIETKAKKVSPAERIKQREIDHEALERACASYNTKCNPKKPAEDLFRGTEPSLWKFWEHGVTSSFLGAYVSCREQARISYVLGYKSRHVPLAFEFGTCCHWILEQAYGSRYIELKTIPSEVWVKDKVEAYKAKWMRETTTPSQKQLEMLELVLGLAEAVLPPYFIRWSGDFTGKYGYPNPTVAPVRWDSLEEVFCLPYTFPDGRLTYLRGRRDGVFVDKRVKVWVFDSKCRSVINHEDACETLPVDLQQMLYLYATYEERRLKGIKNPMPAGTIMNILRRPGHRRGANETLGDFLERIAKDVANPKKFDHNYVRYQMAITPAEILQWKERQLDPMMTEIRMWWEGKLPHYMNPNALISKYGRAELFHPILHGDFSNCYKRKHAFSELAEV